MNIVKITFVFLLAPVLLSMPTSLRAADESGAATPATNPAATQDQAAGPQRFYGPMTAIDLNAKTFTVGDQTFCIIGESHVTKADDSAATLADATVGEPARGSYTKSADGKLNVTKVRFGKKTGGKSGGGKGGKNKTATTQPEK